MNGFVNAHTHVYSGLAPLGMPPPNPAPVNFVQILERVWWRLDRALDERSLRAAARLYAAEGLLHGTTALIDHHESPSFIEGSLDIIADACEEIGVCAVLCYGATERNDGRREAARGLAESRRFIVNNRRSLVRGVVGLHASFTVSDETIRDAASLCRDLGVPMHVHVAEDGADVDDARRRGYAGPLERLAHFGALPPGSILAHGVHLTADQVRRADDLGCWIVQNPRSNLANGVGYPSGLTRSQRVALGTDGFVSDLRAESAALAAESAAHGEPVEEARRRAAGGVALAVQCWSECAGGNADAVVGTCEIVDDRVHRVERDGRVLVNDGTLQTSDVELIRAEARDAATSLWERMARL